MEVKNPLFLPRLTFVCHSDWLTLHFLVFGSSRDGLHVFFFKVFTVNLTAANLCINLIPLPAEQRKHWLVTPWENPPWNSQCLEQGVDQERLFNVLNFLLFGSLNVISPFVSSFSSSFWSLWCCSKTGMTCGEQNPKKGKKSSFICLWILGEFRVQSSHPLGGKGRASRDKNFSFSISIFPPQFW